MNKFYIQIVLFLLGIFLYGNNKALAADAAQIKSTQPKFKKRYPTSREIYENNKHLLCANPEETIEAEKLMNEVVKQLEYHATNKDGYRSHPYSPYRGIDYYIKKHDNYTNIEKMEYKVYCNNKYNKVISEIWDPDSKNFLEHGSVKVKIERVYNPNLVLIQQRYKNGPLRREKYFYALVKKVQISHDTTIIAMVSPNVNDHHPSNIKYKNPIIENANSFKIDIDSEDYIRRGKLKKTFVNIAGYYIKKCSTHVDVTYIASIDGRSYYF
ncbi:fam-a protein [Plasmodium chabaudi chabaudi]|uniref:Fam-a protein n=1 Tax=Plasmodium chabaudi chabaudi TaxID=31271 RepID=A0A4V0K1L5_PLACU|nr:fam-a protein [Plasmodium chabaudi chabaudi]VTZ66340.1 fam-a protein [Plasmodium chabaudi chabaudi]|eukprot:XP_016655468.1 fam-a protein [Plasmodium chabaudi chabaudi]